jgi:hypothetical protein
MSGGGEKSSDMLVTSQCTSCDIEVRIPNLLKYRDEYSQRIGTKSRETPEQDTDTNTDKKDTEVSKEQKPRESKPSNGELFPADDPDFILLINARTLGLYQYYLAHLDKNGQRLEFTKQRKQKGVARFKEALHKTHGDPDKAQQYMECCIDALAVSEYHRTNGYDSWEHNLFPSLEKMEWWYDKALKNESRNSSSASA